MEPLGGLGHQRGVVAVLEVCEHVEAGFFGGGFGGVIAQLAHREAAGDRAAGALGAFGGQGGVVVIGGQLDPGGPTRRAAGAGFGIGDACHARGVIGCGGPSCFALDLPHLDPGQGWHDLEHGITVGAGHVKAGGLASIGAVGETGLDHPPAPRQMHDPALLARIAIRRFAADAVHIGLAFAR